MKRKYIYPLLIIIVTVVFYYGESYIEPGVFSDSDGAVANQNDGSSFYLPSSTTGSIVRHNNYALSYVEDHEQAEWVAYELKKEHLSKNQFKRPYFEEDRSVRTKSADWRNYKKSGYDRGHLCPAGDRRFSYKAFEETFLTSNISPQNHEFNSGVWNKLEQKVRYWANRYNGVYVVTGGVLTKNLKSIGYENISVPKYFYKVLLDTNSEQPKMIAFLLPHKETNRSIKDFVVTTDEIETLTGIDFFPKLEDKLEEKLESSKNVRDWKF